VIKSDRLSSGRTSIPKSSNEFLSGEIHRLESERDAMHRELREIQQSYGWKIVDGYRQWIARHRDKSVVRLYERIAVWVLERTLDTSNQDQSKRYQLWLAANALSSDRIEGLKSEAGALPYRPLISAVLSMAGAASENLSATIDSVRAQLYDNWQLRIVCDASTEQAVRTMMARYVADSRIAVTFEGRNNGTASTATDLGELAHGEFVTFLEQSGQLSSAAFFEVVKRLNRSPLDDLFYWDEDRLDSAGRRTAPFFKPEWSPELLLSTNYLGECFVIRTALAEKLGGLRRSFAPSQNYDLALRAVEASDRIVHIPKVLFHRHDESGSSPGSDHGTAERDRQNVRAIDEALQRRGEHASVATVAEGLYEVRYEIRDQPLVSIVIPTRDKCQLLRQCLESIERNTDYKNYEIVIMDNDSAEPETLQYFEEIAGKVAVHRYPGRFNFSAICNLGVAKANGEFLLFLNNDTQVIRPDWMRALIEQAQRPQVGAVGAKLLFADGRIQHAGAVMGIGGTVGHAFRCLAGNTRHYFGLSDVIRDCSAVTAACMMMRREVYEEVHGFDESILIDFADVDLCLRLRREGYRIVYTPLALLYHYESATRRRMHVPGDYEIFVKRWSDCLKNADPFYSRNLTVNREDWTIAP